MNWQIDSLAAGIDQHRWIVQYEQFNLLFISKLPCLQTRPWSFLLLNPSDDPFSPLFIVTSSPLFLGKPCWIRSTSGGHPYIWGHVLPPHRSHCGNPRRALSDHDARCLVSGQKHQSWAFRPRNRPRNPLVMTNSSPRKPSPIEIDGLPFLIAWWFSMAMGNNQKVTLVVTTARCSRFA